PPGERVIAPYASLLALQVAPRAAVENLHVLEVLGARRGLGFIESLDYTPHRQPAAPEPAAAGGFAPVQAFMAHHQAMGLLACAQVLSARALPRWARREAHLRAVLPLLHERAPHQAARLRERPPATTGTSALRQRWQHEGDPLTSAVPAT